MDVKKALLATVYLSTLGCDKKPNEYDSVFPSTGTVCQSTEIENKFLVHWKNGRITVEEYENREKFIEKFLKPKLDQVEFVENDQRVSLNQYAVTAATSSPTWGQETIGASQAWDAGVTGSGVTVAVIDSGAEITNQQLQNNIYTNSKEVSKNGIDDDHNGYVDDVHGWDFVTKNGSVSDHCGHGTHVSGIILADHDTGSVLGVAPKAKLMSLAFLGTDSDGYCTGDLGTAIEAIEYAAKQGAKVINASWGGPAPCGERSLYKTIAGLEGENVLISVAAGNDGTNIDQHPVWPASFETASQITVGASTAKGYTAYYSNYGNHVHLMAPGDQIFSLYPGDRTVYMSGTSMATPFVAGVAALLWSKYPTATLQQVKDAILESVVTGPFGVSTHGQIHAGQALARLKQILEQ